MEVSSNIYLLDTSFKQFNMHSERDHLLTAIPGQIQTQNLYLSQSQSHHHSQPQSQNYPQIQSQQQSLSKISKSIILTPTTTQSDNDFQLDQNSIDSDDDCKGNCSDMQIDDRNSSFSSLCDSDKISEENPLEEIPCSKLNSMDFESETVENSIDNIENDNSIDSSRNSNSIISNKIVSNENTAINSTVAFVKSTASTDIPTTIFGNNNNSHPSNISVRGSNNHSNSNGLNSTKTSTNTSWNNSNQDIFLQPRIIHFKSPPTKSPFMHCSDKFLPFWYGREDKSHLKYYLQNIYSYMFEETFRSSKCLIGKTAIGGNSIFYIGSVQRVVDMHERDYFTTLDQVCIHNLTYSYYGKLFQVHKTEYVNCEYNIDDGTIEDYEFLTQEAYIERLKEIQKDHYHMTYISQQPLISEGYISKDDFEFHVSGERIPETHSQLIAHAISKNIKNNDCNICTNDCGVIDYEEMPLFTL